MPRILTVDDSAAIRSIVSKQVKVLGFEVTQAKDGVEGLEELAAGSYDMVLLDVTMPNLDGPGMLEKMRAGGDRTPVVMLTSESKKGIIASVMKLGIDDYILKPFKPDELRAKILKTLKLEAAPAATGEAAPAASGGSGGGDLLCIDDMPNVHKKLQSFLPETLSFTGATTSAEAIQACKGGEFKVILLDTVIPGVDSAVLMQQLRALQPGAKVVALALRSAGESAGQGYDGLLGKPFNSESVEDFMMQHFQSQDALTCEDNRAVASAFHGSEDGLKRYFQRLEQLMSEFVGKAADACHDEVIFDMRAVPAQPKEAPALVMAVDKQAKNFGMRLTLVGTREVQSVLSGIAETAALPFRTSLEAVGC